jgi:serine/threonine-protein kinase mTOR
LSLKEFAIHSSTTFHSKTSLRTLGEGGSNEFLDHIFGAIRDVQPMVRACAADALSQCLKILVERRHVSLTGLLCQVYSHMMEGLREDTNRKKRPWHAIAKAEAAQHGSLLVVANMLAYTGDFMLPRYEEVCDAVLSFTHNSDSSPLPKALLRLEVVRLIPRLARRCPRVFGRSYIRPALLFLMQCAATAPAPRVKLDLRPTAFSALGRLVSAMIDESTGHIIGGSNLPTVIYHPDPTKEGDFVVELSSSSIIEEKLEDIFKLVRSGLKTSNTIERSTGLGTHIPSLQCAAFLVEALGELAHPHIPDLINEMFEAGLSNDLLLCLQAIAHCVPAQQNVIENRLLQEVSLALAGTRDVYNQPLTRFRSATLDSSTLQVLQGNFSDVGAIEIYDMRPCPVQINMHSEPHTVLSLVLSLKTLASFGSMVGRIAAQERMMPLLPFVQEVAAQYLQHPSREVRQAAALTCCELLIPRDTQHDSFLGTYSGGIVEHVVGRLVAAAVGDIHAEVRMCILTALDSRYDFYLCQTHHLQELFLLLYDENVVTRAAGLRLLGRLAAINPAPTLPILRKFLSNLIVDLQCGPDTGRGREESTRLLVVYLRSVSLQRLIHPVLPSLVNALSLDKTAPPRLAAASLEALGYIAQATGNALQPWVKDIVPHIILIMQDQSSASKQRTSLRTLGQIAGSTGYVVRPYLEFPKLLTQATEVLPATKRAPWALRREVIRTLGILGALDPGRYYTVTSKGRKAIAAGSAYFFEIENLDNADPTGNLQKGERGERSKSFGNIKNVSIDLNDGDDDLPAYFAMYEQYAMVAQPFSNAHPPKRLTPSDENFYATVAIQALMRIFRSNSLAVHHGMVVQAVMIIFKSLGVRCVPYLPKVVPQLIGTIRVCPVNLRESLLVQLASLSLLVREHLRPYATEIFEVVEIYWESRHLATILNLISNMACGIPNEFRKFVPRLVKRLVSALDELQVTDWSSSVSDAHPLVRGRAESEMLMLLLRCMRNLRGVLNDYLHILIPALLKLVESLTSLLSSDKNSGLPEAMLVEVLILIYRTLSSLLESQTSIGLTLQQGATLHQQQSYLNASETGLASRVVQPILRIFNEKSPKSPSVGLAMIEALCICAHLIGYEKWNQLYNSSARSSIRSWQASFPLSSTVGASSFRPDERLVSCLHLYEEAIDGLVKVNPSGVVSSPPYTALSSKTTSLLGLDGFYFAPSDYGLGGSTYDSMSEAYDPQINAPQLGPGSSLRKINRAALQRAWDVSQRSSRDDWDEWMRRLTIQLLREAPSPALRATANLAQAYQPLARELFSSAFASCWKELSDPYRLNLVQSLETAFSADVSPEILQALLNLAKFMERDPNGPLPIRISVLADLALKCRAYAKALHYKEQEYCNGPTRECVEALISINRKLDLPGEYCTLQS